MGASSRVKGQRGERELQNLLLEHVPTIYGEKLDRNWNQRDGNRLHDITLGPFALEIKRRARWEGIWWDEAVTQAKHAGLIPLLAYRLDRQAWVFQMALRDMANIMELKLDTSPEREQAFTIAMPVLAFKVFSEQYVRAYMWEFSIPVAN